ncbi:hypothetical protein [Psychrobacillus sp.]|uniref:hypothetical protein n=1 Tax=Psychrobacillus sp. TaxID=1871623 RepID=UPI0028BDFF09|nr:hypothetical protein [Psychrobacillus sp.]
MQVTEWYIIRSLTLPASWVSVIIALIVTWLILWKFYGRAVEDWFSDSAIMFIVVWKLSVILTDFKMVVEFPLSILYFNGGKIGVFLGLFAALTKLYVSLRKRGFKEQDLKALLFGFISLQVIYQFLMVFLNDGLMWQKTITIIFFGLFVIFASVRILRDDKTIQQISIVLLLVHIIVAMLQPNGLFQTPLFVTLSVTLFISLLLFQRKSQSKMIRVEGKL